MKQFDINVYKHCTVFKYFTYANTEYLMVHGSIVLFCVQCLVKPYYIDAPTNSQTKFRITLIHFNGGSATRKSFSVSKRGPVVIEDLCFPDIKPNFRFMHRFLVNQMTNQ